MNFSLHSPRLIALIATAANFYCLGIFTWLVLRWLFGDRWWWVFMINTFNFYLFLLVPVLLLVALEIHHKQLLMTSGAALVLGLYLYGGLFLPSLRSSSASGPALTIMTYNILGFNRHAEGVVAAIRAADADVVALQELNLPVAKSIQEELADEYPYQVLNPKARTTGMGVISRYPLTSTGKTLSGSWTSKPQILTLDFAGSPVTVLNLHTLATHLTKGHKMEWSIRRRERQARAVADFARTHSGPLIAPCDCNTTEFSMAYQTITKPLRDPWRAVGWGLGHTFPGADSPGSSHPHVVGIAVPKWLVRIDYVFHSPHWRASWARIGPWDGVSDHRPVVVELRLANN